MIFLRACVLTILVMLSLSITSTKAEDSNVNHTKAWHKFLKEHNKTYEDEDEHNRRKKIFITNHKSIIKHNQSYKEKNLHYNCAINHFADLTSEEFVNIYATLRVNLSDIPSPNPISTIKTKALSSVSNTSKSDSVDWRPTAVTPVKYQAQCGCCWTFSSAASLEGQLYIKTKKLLSLSEQNLLDCVRTDISDGCAGGIMTDAFSWIRDHGIMAETIYPYKAARNSCNYNASMKITSLEKYVQLDSGSESELKKAVAMIGPISVGIQASFSSMQFYSSGIYFEPKCNPSSINHAVLVVGYGSSNGSDYWIIKNSWSYKWGEKGYLRLARNRNNHCGVATLASYPVL